MQFKRFVLVSDPNRNKLSNAALRVLGLVLPFWSQSESGSAALCFSFRRATKTRAGGKWKELVNANIAFKLGKLGYKGRMGNHPATCESVQRESPALAAQHPMQLAQGQQRCGTTGWGWQWGGIEGTQGWDNGQSPARARRTWWGAPGLPAAWQEGMEGQQELVTVGRHQAHQQVEVRSTRSWSEGKIQRRHLYALGREKHIWVL